MDSRIRPLLALVFLALLPVTVWANCEAPLLPQAPPAEAAKLALENRVKVAAQLKAEGVPSFLKATRNGDVPVILLNAETEPKVESLLEHSYGTHVYFQPDWNNDHGGLRDGMWVIDVDAPGDRGYGEINDTGLAWKNMSSYLPRRQPDADKIIEIAYLLSDEEKSTVDYYQRMRRAAIIRVPFTFGDAENDLELPNMLKNGGEHCFTFCKGSSAGAHLSEIDRKLSDLGFKVDEILQKEEVRTFLKAARAKLLKIDPKALKPEMLAKLPEAKALDGIWPKGFKPKQKAETLNWLVGFDATREYQKVLQALEISGDVGYQDMNHARASFVLIYDSPDAAAKFNDASYTAAGKFSTWTADGQKPIR